jgi:multidrug efflux pump
VAKVELFGVQDEKLFIEISQKRLSQLGLDMNQVLAQLGQQNAVEGGAWCRRRWTRCRCVWPGSSTPLKTCAPCRFGGPSGAQLRLGDIAEVKRGYVDPGHREGAPPGAEVIALGVSMAKGGDIIALGKALARGHAAHQQARCQRACNW